MSDPLPAFLTAEWRHLVMLNFEIDPKLLGRHVPAGTELDIWHGRTYVSIVGFRFLNTKLRGFAIPFHRHFSEVNLRFYVRRRTEEGWRRGVVFIKEIVPVPAVTLVARWVYNENYITRPMRHRIDFSRTSNEARGSLQYSWKWREKWAELTAEVAGDSEPLVPESEEEFITEHYWGYTRQRDGATMEYGVEHPAWRVWRATSSRLQCDVASLYGSEFVDSLTRPPTSAFVADGSGIVVRKGTRLS
jgi:uncharacterized protein YqjF (DUF2071 family)